MNKESRTAKSIKNSSIALAFYFVNLVLQFFSRKIFINYLGTEILGLNATATNLLQFLNLAELGIGTAVGFSLYKPFYDNDTQIISEICSLQGKLYRRIAYIVIAGAAILMCFFPLIFSKMMLPLWYAYASFGVLLFSALLSYFVNYKQILLSADQKEYKIQCSYRLAMLVKILVQIFAIKYLENGYIWWLALEMLFAIVASYVLHLTVKHTYPFIKNSKLTFKELNAKYPSIQTKIKQVFVHKIALYVLTQTSPLIIYVFTSLSLVALYDNYMLIVSGFIAMARALSNGLTASVGNLVAEGNTEKTLLVFEELFSVRFFIAAVMCFGMFILTQPFMTLWIGEKYLLSTSTLALISVMLFVSVSRYIIDSFLNAYGFYSDIYAPIIEAFLNIGLSILLGYFFGLNGILSGVLISQVLVVLGWKPIFLFRIKLKQGLDRYIYIYIKHIFLCSMTALGAYYVLNIITVNPSDSFWKLIVYGFITLAVYTILCSTTLLVTGCGIKRFLVRLTRWRN